MTYVVVSAHSTSKGAAARLHNMARKTTKFDMFGVTYRSKQFACVEGLQVMDSSREPGPLDMLSCTEVLVGSDWVALDSRDSINANVQDMAKIMPPVLVLKGLCSVVSDLNFEFLNTWKGIKVPSRFLSDRQATKTNYANPMVAQLTQSGQISLRDLEEYYSLQDAFVMFDIHMAKAVNEAQANEDAASKRAK